jgi:DNA polymerase III delta prime subunit
MLFFKKVENAARKEVKRELERYKMYLLALRIKYMNMKKDLSYLNHAHQISKASI